MQATKEKKTTKVRRDPLPRSTDGVRFRVINKDPNKKYVLVNKAQTEYGVNEYLAMGYDVTEYRSGGASIAGGRNCKPGDIPEYMGTVLMEIDKERADYIDQHGLYGDGGQERADRIEDAIVDKRGQVVDTLRGLHGGNGRQASYISMVNETGSPEVEEGPL